MSKQCEIVQDILPLYVDQACSEASSLLVEEHLAQCPACAQIYQQLQTNTYENALSEEAEGVIGRHARVEKRKTFLVGACIAGILCIPVIVCLIVNLAVGHALDWFFIILTSLMVLASLVVVPLVVDKQKGVWTILSFTASVLLLLLTCAIYTHGQWFWVAGSAVVFGLGVLFLPYLVGKAPLNAFWKSNKGLLVLGADTILLAIMLVCIGVFVADPHYWATMPPITVFLVGLVWVLFVIGRYLPTNKLIRGGLCSMIVGGFCFSVNNIINALLGTALDWPALRWDVWSPATMDGNVKWLILAVGVVVGLVLIIIGTVRMVRSKR